jgi:MFS family permease
VFLQISFSVSSVHQIQTVAVSPIFGHLSDHGWSRKKLIAFGVLLWSLATALGAIANSFGVFLFARMLVGVGEAAYGTLFVQLITFICCFILLPCYPRLEPLCVSVCDCKNHSFCLVQRPSLLR